VSRRNGSRIRMTPSREAVGAPDIDTEAPKSSREALYRYVKQQLAGLGRGDGD
jgi:hypothetical protein